MPQDPKIPQDFSIQKAMAFAASPAGQQLIAILQQSGIEMNQIQGLAASGNTEQAKDALAPLLTDPRIQTLLKQFGG